MTNCRILSCIITYQLSLDAHIVISVGMALWILGIIFVLGVYPSLLKSRPLKMIKYQYLVTYLVIYISNFSIFFLIPAFENAMQVFTCRFNETRGAWISKFDPTGLVCYDGVHWIYILFVFVLTIPFVCGVLKYTKAFKEFGGELDLHDKDWMISLEPFVKVFRFLISFNIRPKCISILIFFISPRPVYYLIIQTIIMIGFSMLLFTSRANSMRWYENSPYSFNI